MMLLAAPAQAQSPAELWVLGGPAFASGRLSAFTQQTADGARLSDSRPFGRGGTGAVRTGAWKGRWGGALELSYMEIPVEGGGLQAGAMSLLGMYRPSETRAWQPYAAFGPAFFGLRAKADYRPAVADSLKKLSGAEWGDIGSLTFDLRLGVRRRLGRRLLFLTEARMTRLPLDESWTPASFFGPPRRHRVGISSDAAPVALLAGLGLEL